MPTSDEDVKLLKIMITAAKKNPVNIGICLGKKPENAVVMMDRKRSPDALGRAAKKAGETSKIAVGVLTVDGRVATLKVEGKPPSGVAKQLRLYFKSIELPLKFLLLDETGAPIADDDDSLEDADADIGDGTDAGPESDPENEEPARAAWQSAWADAQPRINDAIRAHPDLAGKLRAVRDFAMGKGDDGEYAAAQKSLQTLFGLIPVSGNAGQTRAGTPGQDAKALAEQLKALKPQIAALTGPLAQLLNERYTKAVGLMKPATLDAAAAEVARIVAALARVQSEVVTETVGTVEQTPQTSDPRFAKIEAAKNKLLGQVNALAGGDAQDAMLKIVDSVTESIQKREPETALAGMKRIQDGLKLQAEIDRLAPLVAQAASSGMSTDVNAMNLLFNLVVDAVPASDHAKAMANLVRVEGMIRSGVEAPSTFQREIPEDVRPLAVSQLNWVGTRNKIRAEIGRLQDAIRSKLEEIGGMDEAIKEIDKLLDYVVKLDGRLEDKLNDVVNAPAGDNRERLKREARTLLTEYQSELSKPFFDDVDKVNGFVEVDIAASARDALGKISEVLKD